MKFKYNGRIYNPVNTEKKLKKMGITMDDIEIIKEDIENFPPPTSDIELFYFYNPNTGYSITSIYDNDINGYERTTKGIIDQFIKQR